MVPNAQAYRERSVIVNWGVAFNNPTSVFSTPASFGGGHWGVAATAASVQALCVLSSVALGQYWRSSPLVFALAPVCQGLCGSQE